ncbi:MAG: ABC transporter permease [Pseudonocardia sp. SCN 72-86]|nr:MAG: ABC transporter permease [Pseudonocardia sp. SCN 72-86]
MAVGTETPVTAPTTSGRTGDRGIWPHLVALAGVAVILVAVGQLVPAGEQPLLVRTLVLALMAIGWNVMSGFGGMFSFGHAAYYGIGAYTSVWLLTTHGVSPWIGMIAGAVVAALVAVAIGFLSLRYRLKGAYFALATFAFAEMLRLFVTNSDTFNRASGYTVPLRSQSWWNLQFRPNSPNYYYVVLGLVILALLITMLYLRSRSGRFLVAVRDNEAAAGALGIPVMRTKLTAIALSAAITSVAGTFFVQYYFFIDPTGAFGSQVSIQAILPAVIGGVGTIWGPAVGAIVLGPLSEWTASVLREPPGWLDLLAGRAGLDVILYAVLLIVIILVLPKGVYGEIRDRLARR